jgi:ankyrin repeat protein
VPFIAALAAQTTARDFEMVHEVHDSADDASRLRHFAAFVRASPFGLRRLEFGKVDWSEEQLGELTALLAAGDHSSLRRLQVSVWSSGPRGSIAMADLAAALRGAPALRSVEVDLCSADIDIAPLIARCTRLRHARFNGNSQPQMLLAAATGRPAAVQRLLPTAGGLLLRESLRVAAFNGHDGVVELLIARGAVDPVSSAAPRSATALCLAALGGHCGTMALLMRAAWMPAPATWDRHVLHVAASGGHAGTVQLIVDATGKAPESFDGYARNVEVRTNLQIAALAGDERAVGLWLDHGYDINASESAFPAPLLLAAGSGQPACARVLLERGCAIGVTSAQDGGALNIAVRDANWEMVRLLLGAGCDVNAVDAAGRTPLIIAAELGDARIALALVDAGCDQALTDGSPAHRTALQIAECANDSAMVHVLTKFAPSAQTMLRRQRE